MLIYYTYPRLETILFPLSTTCFLSVLVFFFFFDRSGEKQFPALPFFSFLAFFPLPHLLGLCPPTTLGRPPRSIALPLADTAPGPQPLLPQKERRDVDDAL